MVCGEGIGGGSRGRHTARLDALLHDVIRSVHVEIPEFKGPPSIMTCSYAW